MYSTTHRVSHLIWFVLTRASSQHFLWNKSQMRVEGLQKLFTKKSSWITRAGHWRNKKNYAEEDIWMACICIPTASRKQNGSCNHRLQGWSTKSNKHWLIEHMADMFILRLTSAVRYSVEYITCFKQTYTHQLNCTSSIPSFPALFNWVECATHSGGWGGGFVSSLLH